MSEQAADQVGNKLANAAIIASIGFAVGAATCGLSLLLKLFLN